ncbi:hypothetical protein HRU45_00430 [Candidatus Dependentiae bacterium]|nr:hypothetical protein [Candidatus Dependentiae bacterium]
MALTLFLFFSVYTTTTQAKDTLSKLVAACNIILEKKHTSISLNKLIKKTEQYLRRITKKQTSKRDDAVN